MKMGVWLVVLLIMGGLSLRALQPSHYDLIIRNAQIIDGSGSPAQRGDIAISAGRIAAIGKVRGNAKETLDAKGMVVAPGFIDVHTHAESVGNLPLAENFVRMGVTSIITGNCGGSALDIGAFLTNLEKSPVSINVATLVGHNTVRSEAMGGSFKRKPTDAEMTQMKQLVEKAMQDGAMGLSTGLIYLPGTYSETPEIVELAKVVSAHGGLYASHMRSEGLEIRQAIDELVTIAREAKIRAQLSHIKLSGNASWGQAADILKRLDQARAEGLEIAHDQYLYTASSTGISVLIPSEAREGGREQLRQRLANPEQKAKIIADMKMGLLRNGRKDYQYAAIASYSKDRTLNGLRLPQAAKKARGSESLDDQIELIFEIELNGGASGVFHGIDEGDIQTFLQHPLTMFASDSGVRRFNEGAPHPRGYGNNARALARYTRELKLLRLEETVRKMSSMPAQTFGLKERGLLKEGYWADIVIFDPKRVQDTASYEQPHQYPRGIPYVLVNGQFVVRDGKHTNAKPGQPIRKESRR